MAYLEIITFWFGSPWEKVPSTESSTRWFRKDPNFDQAIRTQFLQTWKEVTNGQHQTWLTTAAGTLASIILLDQFPRNMFRDTPNMFSSDAQALLIAQNAIKTNQLDSLGSLHKMFCYLPLEHAEDVTIQNQSVELFSQLAKEAPPALKPRMENILDYALRHREIIVQFGRFPHRNHLQGRANTPQEQEFLSKPGSGF